MRCLHNKHTLALDCPEFASSSQTPGCKVAEGFSEYQNIGPKLCLQNVFLMRVIHCVWSDGQLFFLVDLLVGIYSTLSILVAITGPKEFGIGHICLNGFIRKITIIWTDDVSFVFFIANNF